MNDIKSITISIVVTVIVVGLTELLLPKNEFKNQMRLITGTILLLSMISPFINGFESFDLNINQYENNTYEVENSEKSIASSLNYEIKSILNENKIRNGKVIIKTDVVNESIIISDVNILLNKIDKNKSEIISKEISKKLNIDVKVGEYNE